MTWHVAFFASTVVALAYLAISYAIFRPLVQTRQLRSNRLGLATGTIFFTCAVGHTLHAWHMVVPFASEHTDQVLAARAGWESHDVAWELFTAAVGIYYWSLRRGYGAVLNGASLFEDLRAKEAALHENQRLLAERTSAMEALAASELQLQELALYDSLTGLANRRLLLDRLAHALVRARRQGSCLGVIFVDLDRFKAVNDGFGHDAGDALLCEVAERLRTHVRETDTAARFGGDEFVILCEDVPDEQELRDLAERVLSALSRPVSILGVERHVSASIGVAYSRDGHGEPDNLLLDADRAMYRAKELGRGRYVVFDGELRQVLDGRRQLEADLRGALNRGELRLHYQPIVDLPSGAVTGLEALVRWQHPVHGLLSPAAFVPLAEETGLVVPLGRWVLREACQQLRAWQEVTPGLSVAVNVSAQQLEAGELVQDVAEILAETGVDPGSLCLELTETSLLDAKEATVASVEALRRIGVSIALDDFGTGYSSLTHLHRFPVDVIKIDRSFVALLLTDPHAKTIVTTVLRLADDLGVQALAEGVETSEQLAELHRLGCKQAQGYLFRRPEPAHELQSFLLAAAPFPGGASALVG